MAKRSYQQIRKQILQALSDGKERSYGWLERKVNTNWLTIRNQCHDLSIFKAVKISDNKVRITSLGREASSRL
jgi:hypothetical protein